MRRWLAGLLLACLVAVPLAGQGSQTYKARLSTVPVSAFNSNIVGTGSVTATVAGGKLSIAGSYEGLASPATAAKIYKSPKPGIRGDALFDLSISGGTAGTISAQIDLTPAQVQELAQSRYYVQLFSEKAAEGNLWGWLLPQENHR
ncbi:MAG: CHRD domain-containing protein [Vicinamibacterales bacterium]